LKSLIVSLSLLVSCLAGIPAVAQDLHNNAAGPATPPSVASPSRPPSPCTASSGPANGTLNAFQIGPGAANMVAESFILTGGPTCPFPTIQLTVWMFPGDTLFSVQVSIYSGGSPVFNFSSPPTQLFTQAVNFEQAGCVPNQYGYNVCGVTGNISPPASLAAPASYWLVLSSATTGDGNLVGWDQNGTLTMGNYIPLGLVGPPLAIPAETFSLP
jgi:hypothetical protein